VTIEAFRATVEAFDLDAMMDVFAEDVKFHSPIVYKTYEGKEELRFVLAGVMQVFEDLAYVGEYRSDAGGVLRFRARIGDREIDGIDMLEFGPDNLCHEFTVMVRPYSSATLLRERMAALLQATTES
jgi:hypothetical protein